MFTSTKTFLALLLAVASPSLVSGHGIIKSVQLNGKTYPGALGPGSDPSNSPVRAVSSGDPIDDVTSSAMLCGTDSKNAPMSISAKQGDTLQIFWMAETGINWFHNVGPVQTYMAKCTADCKDFTPDASTQWFKISALGLVPGSDSSWYQAKMNDGSPLPVTIPSTLASGNYLLRHEILALQNGQTKDKAEFYPNCVQMSISGGPNPNAEVNVAEVTPTTTFPGAYKDTDPGILVNVYNPGLQYDMPGPAIANIASGSGSNAPAPSSTGGGASSASVPTATPTHKSPSSSSIDVPAPTSSGTNNSGKCKLRKRASGSSKGVQKRALRAHAKRRMMVEASY